MQCKEGGGVARREIRLALGLQTASQRPKRALGCYSEGGFEYWRALGHQNTN